MKGRAGVIVLGLVGFFIAGAVFLRPTRRETPVPVPQPTEVAGTSPDPIPKPPSPSAEYSSTEPGQGLLIEVVNREGKPIRGARILDARSHKPVVGTTDEAGTATISFAGLHYEGWSKQVKLRIEHDDFAPRFVWVRISEERIRVMLWASAIIDLEVVSREGAPLGGAEVRVDEIEANYWSHPAHPAMRAWKTDDHGRARVIGIPAGAMVIRAQAKGYEEIGAFVVAQEGEPRSVRLVLTLGRRLHVLVRSTSGEPVANAKVEFGDGSTWGMSSSFTGGYRTHYWRRVTDRAGVASFENLPAANSMGELRASSPVHPKIYKQNDLNPEVTDVELTLEAGGTLSVDTVDPGGKSVPCKLVVSGPGLESYDQANQKEKCAGERAVFDGLPVGQRLSVSVYRNEGLIHVEAGITLAPSQTREVTIGLPAHGKVTFTTRDRQGRPVPGRLDISRINGSLGTPVSGLQKHHLNYRGKIGENGTGEVSLLAGDYKVWFTPYEGSRIEKELRVEGDLAVAFDVESDISFTGVIVDPADAPMPNLHIQWFAQEGNWSTRTGADGRFTLRRMTGSSGRLWVNFSGVSIYPYSGPPPAGETKFVFPIATLRGKVVGPDGSPGSVLVYFSTAKGYLWGEDAIPYVSTNAHGTFELRLPCGVWNFSLYGEGTVDKPQPVQVDLSSPGNIVDFEFPLPSGKSP